MAVRPHDAAAVRALGLAFAHSAVVIDSDPPIAFISTYYVSEERQRKCAFARRITITADQSKWKRQVIQTWLPLLDVTAPVDIFVAMPEPAQNALTHPTAAFVVIAQHVQQGTCPALITTDEHGDRMHQAVVLPCDVVKRQLVLEAGLYRRCYSPFARAMCRVRWGWTPITDDPPVALVAGASIHIDVIPLPRPVQCEQPVEIAQGNASVPDMWLEGFTTVTVMKTPRCKGSQHQI